MRKILICLLFVFLLNPCWGDLLTTKIESNVKWKDKNQVAPETWKSLYKNKADKVFLTSEDIELISISSMKSLPSGKSSLPLAFKKYATYLQKGIYPSFASHSLTLSHENKISLQHKQGTTPLHYIHLYFPKKKSYAQLFANGTKGWSVQNPRCLESLLLSGKKVLVYMWISGNWNKEKRANKMDVELGMDRKNLPAVGGHALLLVGFDRDAKQFIFKNSWGEKEVLYIHYDYVKTYARYGLYRIERKIRKSRAAYIYVSEWDIGGNWLKPKAKVTGTISGTPQDVYTAQLLIQYNDGYYLKLVDTLFNPNNPFFFRGEFYRSGALYVIVQTCDPYGNVTAWVYYRL